MKAKKRAAKRVGFNERRSVKIPPPPLTDEIIARIEDARLASGMSYAKGNTYMRDRSDYDALWKMAWSQRGLTMRSFDPLTREVVKIARDVEKNLWRSRA